MSKAEVGRKLRRMGYEYANGVDTVAVHSTDMTARALDEIRRLGWHVQEIESNRIVLAPDFGGLGL